MGENNQVEAFGRCVCYEDATLVSFISQDYGVAHRRGKSVDVARILKMELSGLQLQMRID